MRYTSLSLRIVCAAILLIATTVFAGMDDSAPSALKAPVLLVHGLGEDGSGWGELPALLEAEGYEVVIIDFEKYEDIFDPKKSEQRIEDMVALLARTISGITNKTGISQINIIAHSFGGILVRAYIAGWGSVLSENYDYADNIYSVVYVSTPSFGINKKMSKLSELLNNTDYGPYSEKKTFQSMLEWYGDSILDLAFWFRDNGPTRGVASLSISSKDDAIVDDFSSSLDGELPPYVISHHISLEGYSHCALEEKRTGKPSIINVDSEKHPLFEAAKYFFGGSKLWLKIGNPAPADPGYMIFDFVPSDSFNPTKLGKKAVKLFSIDEDGKLKKVKLKQTSAGLFYALGIKDGAYEIILPFENKKQKFNVNIDIRNSSTTIVKFDPANPGDDDDDDDGNDGDFGDLNLPDEIKDAGSLARFIRTVFPEESQTLMSGEQLEEFARRIRDVLADSTDYPEIERLNDQGQRYGYTAPYSRHVDAFYYVPTADIIDFVLDIDSGGIIMEKLQWARVPPPW